jgi:hypothetical protein
MMNLDKFLTKNTKLIINKYNCNKIFFLSLLETNKLYDDFSIPDKYLCKVGLIKTNELINLESKFLSFMDYDLFIDDKEFFIYKNKLDNLFKLRISINYNEKNNSLEDSKNNENNQINNNNNNNNDNDCDNSYSDSDSDIDNNNNIFMRKVINLNENNFVNFDNNNNYLNFTA